MFHPRETAISWDNRSGNSASSSWPCMTTFIQWLGKQRYPMRIAQNTSGNNSQAVFFFLKIRYGKQNSYHLLNTYYIYMSEYLKNWKRQDSLICKGILIAFSNNMLKIYIFSNIFFRITSLNLKPWSPVIKKIQKKMQ